MTPSELAFRWVHAKRAGLVLGTREARRLVPGAREERAGLVPGAREKRAGLCRPVRANLQGAWACMWLCRACVRSVRFGNYLTRACAGELLN